MRLRLIALVLLVVAAACGRSSDAEAVTSTQLTPTTGVSSSSTTTTTVAEASTTSRSTTTQAPVTTTPAPSTTSPPTTTPAATTTTTNLPLVNNPPVLNTLVDQSTNEDGPFSITVTATDPDLEFLTMSAGGLPAWASVSDDQDGSITIAGRPSFDDAGASVVTVQVTDPDGATDSGSFTITVVNVNQAPYFIWPVMRQDSVGDTVDFSVRALDDDLDVLTWSASGLPPGIAINPANGVISGTIGVGAAGVYSVPVTVSDPWGGFALDIVGWEISG